MKHNATEKMAGRCIASFDGSAGTPPLHLLATELLELQKTTWPSLAEGYAALDATRIREVHGHGCTVQIQFNPRRIVSSGASLDPESIRRRPCFLCEENLPEKQRAVLYRNDFIILCNPAPIFQTHWTIAHIRHIPQSFIDHFSLFLSLAKDFGPRTIIFYNGPECGASAPDHLHYQAIPAGFMPVEKEILDPQKRLCTIRRDGVEICRIGGEVRGILSIEGSAEANISILVGRVIEILSRLAQFNNEPLLNILCSYNEKGWRLIVFPRRKHRPEAFFRHGNERLLISPGAVDMGGMIITTTERDFWALTPDIVREIYREVAFDDAAMDAIFAAL